MNLQKHTRFLLFLLYAVLAAAVLALLLPGLLPFLLALALAGLLERPVCFLVRRLRLKRALSAAFVLIVFTLLLLIGCALLLRRAWYELGLLSGLFPRVLELVQPLLHRAEDLIYRLTVASPPELRSALESALDAAAEQVSSLLSDLSARLLGWMAGVLSALPRVSLFLFTTLLAAFFISAGRPVLFPFLRRQIPARWHAGLDRTVKKLKEALGGWLRAQGILMGVTFLLLAAGFLLIRVDTALLLAAAVAILDALPVFGTGTVLLPWAAVSLLGGNLRRGAALLLLYAVIWVTRSLLEPRLLSRQAGLHPLAALLAMYLGFTLLGIPGLLLAPLAAVILRQLHDSGIVRLWK